jgi:hypothetical protein
MTLDVIVPATRPSTVDRLLYSFSRNTVRPDCITLVSNEITDQRSYGLNVRVVSFTSEHYPIGECDVVLRRNIGIWCSECSHIMTFDDDQIAPPRMVEAMVALLAYRCYCWGHHRFLDFSRHLLDDILALPASAGNARERPPNAFHLWLSAYGGLFGAQTSLLKKMGGFDMIFSGRHAGEDQQLGRRLAQLVEGSNRIYVFEPPFAWHPLERTAWECRYSNLCRVSHQLANSHINGIEVRKCAACPYFVAVSNDLANRELVFRFDPLKVNTTIVRLP